jgi:hypothetical protein
MKKYILAAILCVLPFTVYAPNNDKNEEVVVAETAPINFDTFYSTEESPYVVVKDTGRYKVINLHNVLFIPQFYKRKVEAELNADRLNVQYAKEYIVLVAQ